MQHATDVTVIGLGAMGAALARAQLRAGHLVTVWNRSADRAAPLVAQGARVAPDATAALSASPVILVCLVSYAAADAVLDAQASAQLDAPHSEAFAARSGSGPARAQPA